MKALNEKTEQRKPVGAELIRHLVLAWLTAAAGEFLLLPEEVKTMNGLQALAAMSLPRQLVVTLILLALLEGLSRLMDRRAERWMLCAVFGVLAGAALAATFTWAFLGVCLLVFALLIVYACKGWDDGKRTAVPAEGSTLAASLTAVLAVLFFLLVGALALGQLRLTRTREVQL